MYLQDVGGDENFHLYLQPLDGKPAKDLTDFEGVRAQNLVTDKHYPEEVHRCARLIDCLRCFYSCNAMLHTLI